MTKKSVLQKKDLVSSIVKKTGMDPGVVRKAVDVFFAALIQRVKRGPVHIGDFGTFRTRTRRARQGINPRTGEVISIHASVYPVFLPGVQWKKKVVKKFSREGSR